MSFPEKICDDEPPIRSDGDSSDTHMLSAEKKLLWVIAVLSAIGLAIAGYLTYLAYELEHDTSCPVSGCDVVLTSEYSKIAGVPVWLIGVSASLLILLIALAGVKKSGSSGKWLRLSLFLLSFANVAFGAYFTYVEIFMIEAICILCTASFITGLAIFGASIVLYRSGTSESVA